MATQLSFDLPSKTALGPRGFLCLARKRAGCCDDLGHVLARQQAGAERSCGIGQNPSGPCLGRRNRWADCAARLRCAMTTCPNWPVHRSRSKTCPMIAVDAEQQKTLFHLHNLVLAEGHALLMTGRPTPKLWHLPLADLQSRVEGAHHVALEAPDDALLGAVLAKLFTDRQLNPGPRCDCLSGQTHGPQL